jgi:hypothetical protein
MTLRITLLVLVTGLFALIWTHDRPIPHAGIPSSEIAPVEKPADAELAISSASAVEGQIEIREMMGRAVSHVETVTPMPVILQDEAWMFNDCGMPLPAGIVPGEYRAVSNTGLVREFTLTLADLETYLGVDAEFITRDIYESETESLRWYFIRVQSEAGEPLPVIAERGGHVLLPAVAERSETKRMEQQASRIIVGMGQKLAASLYRNIQSDAPARISAEIKDSLRL